MDDTESVFLSTTDLAERWGLRPKSVKLRLDRYGVTPRKFGRANWVSLAEVEAIEAKAGVPGFGRRPRPLIEVLAEDAGD